MASERMNLVLACSVLVILELAQTAHAYCYAIASSTPLQSFQYNAVMTTLGSCNPANVNVSKFYMSGACVNSRSNDFNYPPDCSKQGGSVNDATLATCERVFSSSAPKGTFQLVSSVGVGRSIDSGNVCNSGLQGFFFVSTNCTTFKQQAQLQFTNQANNYCNNNSWRGSHGLAYGVKIAISIVIICLLVLTCCLGFVFLRRRRTAMNNQGPAVVGMQPYPQAHQYPQQQQQPYGHSGQMYSNNAGQPYGGSGQPYGGSAGQPYGGNAGQPYGGQYGAGGPSSGPVYGYPAGKTDGSAPPGYPSRV